MGAVIEVKYFNSFVLKKTGLKNGNNIIWDGSEGIPSNVAGGYPVVLQNQGFNINDWAIEEARIRGGPQHLALQCRSCFMQQTS